MSEQIKNQYNSLYSNERDVFGAGKPVGGVEKIPEYVVEGKVLDIGGGEGKNALYLAEQGYDVSVYDISEVGIERLNEAAKERELTIDARVVDIVQEDIDGTFDSVVITFVLHHIDTEDAVAVIKKAQDHTAENGVHVIYTFANEGDLYERGMNKRRFYPSEAQMRELFEGWDIKEMTVSETTTHARHKNGERMKNQVIKMIAVKTT